MLGPYPKRQCDNPECRAWFRPRQEDQRYCRAWCRDNAKAAEFRTALALGRKTIETQVKET